MRISLSALNVKTRYCKWANHKVVAFYGWCIGMKLNDGPVVFEVKKNLQISVHHSHFLAIFIVQLFGTMLIKSGLTQMISQISGISRFSWRKKFQLKFESIRKMMIWNRRSMMEKSSDCRQWKITIYKTGEVCLAGKNILI